MSQTTTIDHGHVEESLLPFSGRVLLGICFESGHSLWLYDFDTTPTGLGGYREFWVVDPDDTRTFYYDTEGEDVEVARFHEWDRSALAEMAWEWTDDHIHVTVHDPEGTTVEFEAKLGDSWASRLVSLAQRLPEPVHRRVWGRRTETGTLGQLKASTVRSVTEATARIDGTSLGEVRPPERPITFGDVNAFDRPLVFTGDLLLEYPVE